MPNPTSSLPQPVKNAARSASNMTAVVRRRISSLASKESPWDHAASPSDGPTTVRESPHDRAVRQGFVQHGEFDLKIAYDSDVISDKVIDTIERGAYERFEGRRSKAFIAKGDRVVELGAGLGFLSALIMKNTKVGDYQMVEADPRLPVMMDRTHELNGVAGPSTIQSCVATNHQGMIDGGEVEFHVGKKFCASSLMGANNLKHSVRVPVVSLAEMVAEHDSNVLICDIEGSEVDIFNGTPMPTIEKILMEIHPHRIGQEGVRGIFQHLDALDYVYDADGSAGGVIAFRRLAPTT